MIKDYAKFEFGEGSKVEVNYSPEVIPCKKIKVTIGEVSQEIDHADFYAMMMLFGEEAEQDKLLRVQQTEMKPITRMFKLVSKKDVKKGESFHFPFTYYVPIEAYEKVKDLKNVKDPEGSIPTFKEIVNQLK